MYMMFCGVDGKLPAFKMDLAVALKDSSSHSSWGELIKVESKP